MHQLFFSTLPYQINIRFLLHKNKYKALVFNELNANLMTLFVRQLGELQIDQSIIDKIMTIQQLPEDDRHCIMYAIDGLIRDAKARTAYAS